jgi:heptosyltransferase III
LNPPLTVNEPARRGEPSSWLPGLPEGSKILILRLRSLGDLVLETPAIAALHSWRPDLQIYVLVDARFAAVFEGNPAVTRVILSGGFFAAARALRQYQFPIVFNQHGGPRSALLTATSGSPLRVCWKGFQFSFLYNVLVPDAHEFYGKPVVHTVEHRISQFYWTGLPRAPIPTAEVFPQREAVDSVCRNLAQSGIGPGAPYAVLQPGARLPGMRWPIEKFAEVARWLRMRHDIASVVNLASAEAAIAPDVRRLMRDCAVIPEPFSVRELIALMAGARMFIGNDSGPAHLAAAAGRPSVVVYGSTNPAQWHPWQTNYRAVHTNAVFRPLRGDKSLAEGESRSIRSLPVEEVRVACDELLAC